MKVIWKFCASIVNNILWASITLHDVLYGFRQGRGVGTATMLEKLAQQFAGIVHKPIFQVSRDV